MLDNVRRVCYDLYMSKAIVVKSTGKQTVGKVTDTSEVILPTKDEIEAKIRKGMESVARIASGEKVEDPTAELKHCSRCLKLGRHFLHPLTDFSVKKNGQRHSQCKKCRTEQACEWQVANKARRAIYQEAYQATRPKRTKQQRVMNKIIATVEAPAEKEKVSAIFVTYTE